MVGISQKKGAVVPDDEAFGKSGTSGNFLIGRPARFPFGGIMEVLKFDNVKKRRMLKKREEGVMEMRWEVRGWWSERVGPPKRSLSEIKICGEIMSKQQQPIISSCKNSKLLLIGPMTTSYYVKTIAAGKLKKILPADVK